MEFVLIVLGLVLLDFAAMRWGANSVESVDNGEWSRRKYWRGLARR